VIAYKLVNQKMTSASGTTMEEIDVSILKLFLITYLIGKVVVALLLMLMYKSFVFPIAMSSAIA
jgi:hypothetical protein